MKKRIVVDADSCPVKTEILQVAREFNIPAIFVASFAHFSTDTDMESKIIYVDSYNQSVDLFIINYITQGDVVVTGDYGLASIVLKPGISALSFRGTEYTEDNINGLLMQRHVSAKLRSKGERVKGPSKLTNEDRKKFVEKIREILKN